MIARKHKQCICCGNNRPVFKYVTIDGDRLPCCSYSCSLQMSDKASNVKKPTVKPPTPIKKLSPKQAKIKAEYLKVRLEYLNKHPYCEINWVGCTGSATDLHHSKGRGINTTEVKFFKASCRNCHDKIHFENPKLAHEQDLL